MIGIIKVFIVIFNYIAHCDANLEGDYEDEQLLMTNEVYQEYGVMRDNNNNITTKLQSLTKRRLPLTWFRWRILDWIQDILQLEYIFGPNDDTRTNVYLILYIIVMLSLAVALFLLGLFCRTGAGCCCFKWLAKYPLFFFCDLKATKTNMQKTLLTLTPGLRIENEEIISTYDPTAEEILAFIEVIKRLRELP